MKKKTRQPTKKTATKRVRKPAVKPVQEDLCDKPMDDCCDSAETDKTMYQRGVSIGIGLADEKHNTECPLSRALSRKEQLRGLQNELRAKQAACISLRAQIEITHNEFIHAESEVTKLLDA